MTEQDKQQIAQGNNTISIFMNHEKISPYDCQYDNNWNHIMPVVKKIEKFGFDVDIWSVKDCKGVTISSHNPPDYDHGNLINAEHVSKITSVWLAVIEFINWHNKNLKP